MLRSNEATRRSSVLSAQATRWSAAESRRSVSWTSTVRSSSAGSTQTNSVERDQRPDRLGHLWPPRLRMSRRPRADQAPACTTGGDAPYVSFSPYDHRGDQGDYLVWRELREGELAFAATGDRSGPRTPARRCPSDGARSTARQRLSSTRSLAAAWAGARTGRDRSRCRPVHAPPQRGATSPSRSPPPRRQGSSTGEDRRSTR